MQNDADLAEGAPELGAFIGEGRQVSGEGRLPAGTVVEGRWELAGLIWRTPFGEVHRATDRQTGQSVAARLLDPELVPDEAAVSRLAQIIPAVARLEHKNLARTLGWAKHEGLYIVFTEHVDGQTLRALLDRRKAQGGGPFTLKAAYNVVQHVIAGLAAAHQVTWHGALSASNVLVDRAGRVKITELGLGRAFPGFVRLAAESPTELSALAPEVATSPKSADARADVYAVGTIIYELLTGRSTADSMARPSAVQQGLGPDVDQIVARCLAPDPAARFADLGQLRAALVAVVERQPNVSAQMQAQRMSGALPAVPQVVRAPQTPPRGNPVMPTHSAGASGIAVNESDEKWLVQKGKLDFGPFSFAQIRAQIAADQIEPGNVIIDNENGRRCKVEEHPLLTDLVYAAVQKRDDSRRANAEAVVVKQDTRKGATLYAVIGLGVAALLVGGYFVVKKLRASDTKTAAADMKALEGAEYKVDIKFPDPPPKAPRDPNRPHGGGHHGGGVTGPSGGFNDNVDLGSADDDEETETLDNAQINPVVGRAGGKLGGCLQGSGEHSASIVFIIRGNGRVSDVKVNESTTSPLARCTRGVLMSLQFPTFNGPRTKANFSMSM